MIQHQEQLNNELGNNDAVSKIQHEQWLQWWLSRKGWLSIGGITLGFLIILGIMFFWHRDIKPFDSNYVLANDVWGNYGDFVGGVCGPILALIGVIVTMRIFIDQQRLTKDIDLRQERQTSMQRFNDLFFQLLNLHRQQIHILDNSPLIGFRASNTNNCDFFKRFREEFVKEKNISKNYHKGNKQSIRYFTELYLSNASILAPYFRVLYRIFDLIDTAKIDEHEKVRYAKLARAQLSEGELFAIRYNGFTQYGKKFIKYINKYRLLKHLPVLSLVEMQITSNLISTGDSLHRYALNMLFYTISQRIYGISIGIEPRPEAKVSIFKNAKYHIELLVDRETRTTLYVSIDNRAHNTDPFVKFFRTFNSNDYQNLLSNILREIYIYSNYGKYNKPENLDIQSEINDDCQITSIKSYIERTDGKRLRLNHPDLDKVKGLR